MKRLQPPVGWPPPCSIGTRNCMPSSRGTHTLHTAGASRELLPARFASRGQHMRVQYHVAAGGQARRRHHWQGGPRVVTNYTRNWFKSYDSFHHRVDSSLCKNAATYCHNMMQLHALTSDSQCCAAAAMLAPSAECSLAMQHSLSSKNMIYAFFFFAAGRDVPPTQRAMK